MIKTTNKEFEYQSEAYVKMLDLRNRGLRIPLGLSMSLSDTDADFGDRHFGTWIGDELAAGLMIRPLENDVYQLRQMVVDPLFQRKGLGLQLVQFVEAKLVQELTSLRIILFARVEVMKFYERLGYEKIGAVFVHLGIAHQKMGKSLPIFQ